MYETIESLLANNEIFTLSTLLGYWDGLVMTVQLVFLSLIIGLMLAIPLAILRTSDNWFINRGVWLFTYVFRGTPLLIQLYIIYYGVTYIEGIQDSMFWPIVKDAFYPCLLAFVLNTAAYTTEIFRGAIVATLVVKLKRQKPTVCLMPKRCVELFFLVLCAELCLLIVTR
ncbi:ABC transporter permease subunit [Agarivorans gilvus]|uniref:ABC transporter permease subunit n=1 Tax=Agarivorans gilvus TaxID=680279 RepID=UPI000AE72E58|nr:ABC transporter permease subunit [Agarivorans gilvus]